MSEQEYSERRSDFDWAYNMCFGKDAKKLSDRAREVFINAGSKPKAVAEAEAKIRSEFIALLKDTYPEFADVVDERMKEAETK